MNILNELVELANKANVAGQGTPEMIEFRVVANPDTIIAIAQEFSALGEAFDELANAIGWSRERCEQTGESPKDVAVSLVNLVSELEKDAFPTTDEWAIDNTCGRPILVYKGCSVIEAGDAAYILNLVKQDRTAIRDASHEV